jgi:hypothetical protein
MWYFNFQFLGCLQFTRLLAHIVSQIVENISHVGKLRSLDEQVTLI